MPLITSRLVFIKILFTVLQRGSVERAEMVSVSMSETHNLRSRLLAAALGLPRRACVRSRKSFCALISFQTLFRMALASCFARELPCHLSSQTIHSPWFIGSAQFNLRF